MRKDISLTAKAVSFCWSLKDRENTLTEYNDIILNVKKNIKQFNFFVC